MGTVVKPHTFSSSTTALSSEVNANFDTLYTLVNGNIEEANLANGAVTENKLASGAVTNGKVDASAAIALSKLAALTASIVPVADASGFLTSSAVTATELGYVSGVTSAIQTQLDGKVDDATLTSHTGDTANPHSVTAAQAGAVADGMTDSTLYAGSVGSDGTADTLPTGWTSAKTGTGAYTVTPNFAPDNTQAFLLTTRSGSATSARYRIIGSDFIVSTFDDTGTTQDTAFTFVCVVP